MTTIRVQTLQWTAGVLCALIGMLALVTPHQFSAVTYAILQPNLELWGAAFVLVGAGLIGMATIGGSRRAEVLLHVSAALVLGLLALGSARTPSCLGLVNYSLLALGAGLNPLIRRQLTRSESELLPLVIGASLLLMLLAQLRIAAPAFDSARPTRPFEAGLFLIGGSALIVHQLVRWPSARWFRLAQAPAIAALLAHLVTSGALSAHVWIGIAYYGGINLTRASHGATDLVDQAVAEMRGLAGRSAVHLVLSDVGGIVDADTDRVVQVLANLLSNAIKFSGPGQRLWVSATATGEVVRFSVLDEGRGIPADKLDMIFERFSQVDASDSREKGGTGLGLPICRSIVECHGGRIWAERPAGGGSRFVFDLPRAELAAQAA